MVNKYLICRPEGGINDILCQVYKCLCYCQKYDRILIIDTESSDSFADEFGYYFNLRHSNVISKNTKNISNNILTSGLEFFPYVSLKTLINTKPVHNPQDNYNICGVPLTFDFNVEYKEPILIHHQCGGGDASQNMLALLSITKPLCNLLNKRVNSLPFFFTGYHCRNTDMQSNTAAALHDIKNMGMLPIFISSDSFQFMQEVKKIFGINIFSFSSIPNFSGRPIHHETVTHEAKRLINTDSILDLFTLGLARNVISSNLNSGYGRLAVELSKTISVSNLEIISPRLSVLLLLKSFTLYSYE